MKRILTHGALALTLALCAASPAALAKGIKKKKPSPEHIAAVKACNDTYNAANKAAKALKGKERKDAMMAARQARKQCLADAPK